MKTFDVFAAATALILVKIESSDAGCPEHYTEVGTRCYRFPAQRQITWHQAYFLCQNEMGGYLVEIENQQEQNILKNYIESVADPTGQYAYWIGATDLQQEGVFKWMTWGDAVTFSAWKAYEPNDYGAGEDCAIIEKFHNYKWNDMDCSYSRNLNTFIKKAICEATPI